MKFKCTKFLQKHVNLIHPLMCMYVLKMRCTILVQWNLVIKRSDITKPSYNTVILLVPALYISEFFYPDIMRNRI